MSVRNDPLRRNGAPVCRVIPLGTVSCLKGLWGLHWGHPQQVGGNGLTLTSCDLQPAPAAPPCQCWWVRKAVSAVWDNGGSVAAGHWPQLQTRGFPVGEDLYVPGLLI